MVGADTLDRLTVLGAIGRNGGPGGAAAARSRARAGVAEHERRTTGLTAPTAVSSRSEVESRGRGEPAAVRQAGASGIPPDSLEQWLYAMLEAWRDATPDSLVEPWDWYYAAGEASRGA